MRRLSLDAGTREALREEIRATAEARRLHRLHAVLLVAGGLSCRNVARLLGDSPRSVEYWVHRYERDKSNGLNDKKRLGRPPFLRAEQALELETMLTAARASRSEDGRAWTGAELCRFIADRWGIELGERQAQRLLARLLRKP